MTSMGFSGEQREFPSAEALQVFSRDLCLWMVLAQGLLDNAPALPPDPHVLKHAAQGGINPSPTTPDHRPGVLTNN